MMNKYENDLRSRVMFVKSRHNSTQLDVGQGGSQLLPTSPLQCAPKQCRARRLPPSQPVAAAVVVGVQQQVVVMQW